MRNADEHASPGPGVGVRVGVCVAVGVGVGVVASGARRRRPVDLVEGDLSVAVGAADGVPARALVNLSCSGEPSMRTDSPPRRTRSFATVFIG